MKIGIIGLGYIGSVTAGVLAEAGNDVIGIEIDKKRLDAFNNGEPPIFEPGLKELIAKNKKRLTFTSDYSRLKEIQVAFLTVPTPTVNGRIDLSYIFASAKSVAEITKTATLIIKSTVVPGTAAKVNSETGLAVVSNPEFTKEGTAIDDTRRPDRIIIGAKDGNAANLVEKIWEFTEAPILKTTNENAELIKYASNSFLATKISFINELANLCETISGCDVETVAKGMGFDKRISPYFLKAGIGYGGSCFPKDTTAIAEFAKENKSPLTLVETAIKINSERIDKVISLLKEELGNNLREKKIGVLGLTFKQDTDDTRGSQAIQLIERLLAESAIVNVYDPIAKVNLENVKRFKTKEDCIENSVAIIIATEWPEFKNIKVNDKLVIDAKRILPPRSFNNLKSIGLSWRK